MTRGNRQGNQAFVYPSNLNNIDPVNLLFYERFYKYFTEEIWKTYVLATRTHQDLASYFIHFSMTGNTEILKLIIKEKSKHENFGFNKLHSDVLELK